MAESPERTEYARYLEDIVEQTYASEEAVLGDVIHPDCTALYGALSPWYSGLVDAPDGSVRFDPDRFDLRIASIVGGWSFRYESTGETLDEQSALERKRVAPTSAEYHSNLDFLLTLNDAAGVVARSVANNRLIWLPLEERWVGKQIVVDTPDLTNLSGDALILMQMLGCWLSGGFPPEDAWRVRASERELTRKRSAEISGATTLERDLRHLEASIPVVHDVSAIPPSLENADWYLAQDVLGDGACFYRSIGSTLFARLAGVNVGKGSFLPLGVQNGVLGAWRTEVYPAGREGAMDAIANALAKWIKFYAYLVLCTEIDPVALDFDSGVVLDEIRRVDPGSGRIPDRSDD